MNLAAIQICLTHSLYAGHAVITVNALAHMPLWPWALDFRMWYFCWELQFVCSVEALLIMCAHVMLSYTLSLLCSCHVELCPLA